jgi:hypothetical protein
VKVIQKIKEFKNSMLYDVWGYPLRVSSITYSINDKIKVFWLQIYMIEYPAFSQRMYDENQTIIGYKYLDGEIVNIIIKKMNFTPIYINGECCFGYKLPNGSFIKDLGIIENDEADLVGVQSTSLDYNTTMSLYLTPISYGKYFFVVPSPRTTSEVLLSMINSFDFTSNALAFSLLITFPVVLYFIYQTEGKIQNLVVSKSFGDCVLDTISVVLNYPIRFPTTSSPRAFFATVMLYALIMTAIMQGTIIKNLNSRTVMGKIETLDQLLDSNLEIHMDEDLSIVFLNVDGSRVARKLKEIARHPKNKPTSLNSVAKLLYFTDINPFIDLNYDNFTKKDKFTVVPEAAFEFYESMIVQKNSPFQDKFNHIIDNIKEAGIVEYQKSIAEIENIKIKMHRVKTGNTPADPDKAIELNEVAAIFNLYLCMNFLAILVLGLEMVVNKIRSYVNTK